MPVTFPRSFIIVNNRWTDFKTVLLNKLLTARMQYDDDGQVYTIFAFDTPIAYVCTIWQGTVPDSIVSTGYSQAQNDADKSDFETNYKTAANTPIEPRTSDGSTKVGGTISVSFSDMTVVDGYTTTTSLAFSAIYAATYNEQTSNAQRSIASVNVNDTNGGTGAQAVRITYYDDGLAGPYTEDVTLNGTTPVNTVNSNICYIERIDVISVGSQLSNIGNLYLYVSVDGAGGILGIVVAGDGETNWCHHYISSTKVTRVTNVYGHSIGLTGGSMQLRSKIMLDGGSPEHTVAPVLVCPPGQQMSLELSIPLSVQGPAKIVLYAKPGTATSTDWLGGFNYYDEDAS